MAKTNFKSVDEYISSQPEAAQRVLLNLRSAIRNALPNAAEIISYQMPTYKVDRVSVLWFAGWKNHFSLYPASDLVVATFKDELSAYTVDNATIRFPITEPVPEELIGRIAKFRAIEVTEREKTK